jgi:predicted metal-dependent peptidase
MYIIVKKVPPLDPEKIRDAEKRFEWLVSFLICRFKFVHHILGVMVKEATMHLETMGVIVTEDGKFKLFYNPVFVDSLTDQELTYVLYHEVCHLSLHHCTSRMMVEIADKKRMTQEERAMLEIAQKAYDLAVNELIPVNDACQPPRDEKGNLAGCFVSEFKKMKEFEDIEERQTAEWYYQYLRDKAPPSSGGGSGGGGQSGSQTQPGEGEPQQGQNFDDHDGWREHETADERVRAKIREVDQNDLWGDVSSTQKELILAAQVRKINWRNKIRTFFGNLAWKYRQSTRKRPDRRYGYMFPGKKKLFVDRWLVAADTSGSVDADLLSQWLGVVNQLADEFPIDFMQFDCEKTEDPWPFDRRKLKLEFKGRGGTDFQPVMDIVEKRRYKGVMLLTDGEASAPTKPKIAKVLWVLPAGHNPPVDWGQRVHLVRGI